MTILVLLWSALMSGSVPPIPLHTIPIVDGYEVHPVGNSITVVPEPVTMTTPWLSYMRGHAPTEPVDRMRRLAEIIVEETDDPVEQAQLVVISFYETTWGRRGIPFGVSSMHHSELLHDPVACARFALRILRRAHSLCPTNIAGQLGFYHHGRGCVSDLYSRSEARTIDQMRQWVVRWNIHLPQAPRSLLATN